MIARIVPYTRTIRGMDFFDYDIPDDLQLTVGDLVRVPFRHSTRVGLVWEMTDQSPTTQRRSIIERLPYKQWRASERRIFCAWFAQYYAVSLPHAWKTIQYAVPKRLPLETDDIPVMIREAARSTRESIVIANKRSVLLRWYTEYIRNASGHTLIIVPEYRDVLDLKPLFPSTQTVAFHAEPTSTALIALEARLQRESKQLVVIGTKKCVFLPWTFFDTIILDQEESRSHKQYQLNPRYHVRRILEYIHAHDPANAPNILYTSLAPSMELASSFFNQSRDVIDLRTTWESSHILCVDMEQEYRNKNYSWLSAALEDTIREQKKVFLFLNRIGAHAALLCADCHTLGAASSSVCAQCGSTRIRVIRKGTEQLEQELRTRFPHKQVVRIDRQTEPMLEEIARADIIIGTEKVFRVVPPSFFDSIGILSIDHLLVYPHFASHERVFQLLTTLFCAGIPTIIQTHAPHHPVIQYAIENRYEPFAQAELALRQSLHLPPYAPYISVMDSQSPHGRRMESAEQLKDLPHNVRIDRWA